MIHRQRLLVPVVSLSLLIFSCRKTDKPAIGDGADDGTIATPVTIDLIPAQNQTPGDRRIYLPISKIGTSSVSLKTVFDSGSEGLLLSGTSVLPAAAIADTGVVISNPDSAIINGITVTSAKVQTTYGNPPATRTFYGNIAYASLTFGDQNGSVVTERMPFIIIYKGVDNQTQASVALDNSSDGVAGVYSTGYTPATGLVTTRTGVKSPFNYFNYTNGIFAGFLLSPLNRVGWSATVPSNQGYSPTPLLTIGVTSAMESGFALQSQRVDVGGQFDPNLLASVDYNGTTVSNANILLDTGTPLGFGIYTHMASGTTTLSGGLPVDIRTNEAFSFSYTTDGAFYQTVVTNTGQQRCIFGIDFFMSNAYLLDYTEHYIGLKGS